MIKRWRSVVPDPLPPVSFVDAKKIFRRNALKCHPDKGGNAVDFRNLNEAFESLQHANTTSTITILLALWRLYWDICSTQGSAPRPPPPPAYPWEKPTPPPPPPPTLAEALATVRAEDALAEPEHKTGKAAQEIAKIDAPALRKYFFSMFRMKLNASKYSHEIQAQIMQNVCSVVDAALLLLQMLLDHPSLRSIEHDILIEAENIDVRIRKLFKDEYKKSYGRKYFSDQKIRDEACGILQYIVIPTYRPAWNSGKVLFALKYEPRIYQIRQLPRYHASLDKLPDGNFFSEEELKRFAQERDELLDPVFVIPTEQAKQQVAAVEKKVAAAQEQVAEAKKEVATAKQEVQDIKHELAKSLKDLDSCEYKFEVQKARVAMFEEKLKKSELSASCAVTVSNKRSHSVMIAAPAVHVVSLVKALAELFAFLENLESSEGFFNVCDAIRHAYMIASAQEGTELEYEDASKAASNRLAVIRPALVAAGAKIVLFGKTKAVALCYPDLSDVLLQDKRLGWFRRLHIQIVGNTLLPCQEVHLALASHLQAVAARVDAKIVADVLGVTMATAKTMTPRLQEVSAGKMMKAVQCLQLVKDHGSNKRQCKKMAKIADTIDLSKALCCYHTASAKANKK